MESLTLTRPNRPRALISLVPMIDVMLVSGITVAMLAIHWFMRNRYLHDVAAALPRWLLAGAWGVMVWLIIISQGQSSAFIYFQF